MCERASESFAVCLLVSVLLKSVLIVTSEMLRDIMSCTVSQLDSRCGILSRGGAV